MNFICWNVATAQHITTHCKHVASQYFTKHFQIVCGTNAEDKDQVGNSFTNTLKHKLRGVHIKLLTHLHLFTKPPQIHPPDPSGYEGYMQLLIYSTLHFFSSHIPTFFPEDAYKMKVAWPCLITVFRAFPKNLAVPPLQEK